MLRRVLKKRAGVQTHNRAAAALGIDFTAGQSRRKAGMAKQAQRFLTTASRKRRLRNLHKAVGSRAAKIAQTGLRPTALYGAEVYGVSDVQLTSLRRSHAAAVAPRAQGRSLD
eukprot:3885513-Karenia_brevis.AAC.1